MRFSVFRPRTRKARAVSGSPKSFSSFMSPPAQKARSPAPAKTMQRASESASAWSNAAFSAFSTLVETAFTGGLSSVMVMTWPSFSIFTSLSDTRRLLFDRDLGRADDGAPQHGFVLQPLLHRFDRAAGADEALLEELVLHLLAREDFVHRPVQKRNDGVGRRRRRHQEDPGGEVHVRQPRLAERRHV